MINLNSYNSSQPKAYGWLKSFDTDDDNIITKDELKKRYFNQNTEISYAKLFSDIKDARKNIEPDAYDTFLKTIVTCMHDTYGSKFGDYITKQTGADDIIDDLNSKGNWKGSFGSRLEKKNQSTTTEEKKKTGSTNPVYSSTKLLVDPETKYQIDFTPYGYDNAEKSAYTSGRVDIKDTIGESMELKASGDLKSYHNKDDNSVESSSYYAALNYKVNEYVQFGGSVGVPVFVSDYFSPRGMNVVRDSVFTHDDIQLFDKDMFAFGGQFGVDASELDKSGKGVLFKVNASGGYMYSKEGLEGDSMMGKFYGAFNFSTGYCWSSDSLGKSAIRFDGTYYAQKGKDQIETVVGTETVLKKVTSDATALIGKLTYDTEKFQVYGSVAHMRGTVEGDEAIDLDSTIKNGNEYEGGVKLKLRNWGQAFNKAFVPSVAYTAYYGKADVTVGDYTNEVKSTSHTVTVQWDDALKFGKNKNVSVTPFISYSTGGTDVNRANGDKLSDDNYSVSAGFQVKFPVDSDD